MNIATYNLEAECTLDPMNAEMIRDIDGKGEWVRAEDYTKLETKLREARKLLGFARRGLVHTDSEGSALLIDAIATFLNSTQEV